MSENDNSSHELGFVAFVLLYLGILGFNFAAPVFLSPLLGVSYGVGVCGLTGLIFLLGATGHPWWLYETLRSVRGWGIGLRIGSVRLFLVPVGLLFLLLAVLGYINQK